jgi:hypothetical protein
MRASLLGLFSVALLSTVACSNSSTTTSSGGSGGGGSSGSTPVAPAECKTRCEAKATTCAAPPAQATQACAGICGSATTGQLTCLEAKSCAELNASANLLALCPAETGSSSGGSSGSTGGTVALGGACTCPNVTGSSVGSCAGTNYDCAPGLSCVYEVGSSGKGKCYASRCCTDTTKCDNDNTLLTACSQGKCQRTGLGWYCGK